MEFLITEDCELDLLNKIEDYLIRNRNKDDAHKIYFSGEFDSHQSKFEYASNNLLIGVIASNETEGLLLLRLLRIIIDDREDLLIRWDWEDGTSVHVKDIVERLAKTESNYINSFDPDQKISRKLMHYSFEPPNTDGAVIETEIIKTLDEIDIWTFSRIMKEIKDLY